MGRGKLVKPLLSLIFFIFAANFLANKFFWYYSLPYLDMIMHFLGGFWVGLASLYLFLPQNFSARDVFKILSVVILIGAGWEVFETLVNETVAGNPLNWADTLSDLFFDLLGGICAILCLYRWKKLSN